MDELDLLKKDWNKSEKEHKKLSVKEIYPMLHKKSSSIVKMLFYISIGELIFWILINSIPYFSSDAFKQKLDTVYTNDTIFNGLTIFSYVVITIFIYLLYRSYKLISVTDSSKKLMENILKTRKIIKYYVLYNLIIAGVSLVVAFYYAMHYDPELINVIESIGENGLLIFIVIITIVSIIFISIFWLFYRLIYGFLLKRLNKNYNELKRLEV